MSKGLEALEYLKNKGMIHNNAISRGCVVDIEKELKAFEIIKNYYSDVIEDFIYEVSQTKEEWNFLKEVLL